LVFTLFIFSFSFWIPADQFYSSFLRRNPFISCAAIKLQFQNIIRSVYSNHCWYNFWGCWL